VTGPSETRGDRLAEIEERAEFFGSHSGLVTLPSRDVLALVEIAKAARLIQAFDQAGGNDWWEAHAKLYAALARLDGGATEENA